MSPGIERYCNKCEGEIVTDGSTQYEGKTFCECAKKEDRK